MKKFYQQLGHHGFTLVEIMVALMLVVLIFTIIPLSGSDPEHSDLEESIYDIDRAIKFSINESILRNAVTRLLIDLDTDPIEYAVEYGPGGNLVLPTPVDEERLSVQDREYRQKEIQNLDAQFNRVNEFSENMKKLPDGVYITGIASSYMNEVKKSGKISIYFYPTGEKDNALIFFTTTVEMAWLDIPPFENTTTVDYYTYTQDQLVNLDDSQDNKMEEVYDQWRKE